LPGNEGGAEEDYKGHKETLGRDAYFPSFHGGDEFLSAHLHPHY
jgi:hypothetical protein